MFALGCGGRVPDPVVKKYLSVRYGGTSIQGLTIAQLTPGAEGRAFEARKRRDGPSAELRRLDPLSDADRANGATDRLLVEWSGAYKDTDGTARQTHDAAIFTRHASGVWLTDKGIFDAEGRFTHTKDLTGTYRAEVGSDRWYFADCTITLGSDPEHSGFYDCHGKNGRKRVMYHGSIIAAVVVEADPALRKLVRAPDWTYIIAQDAEGVVVDANLEAHDTKLAMDWDVTRGLSHGGEQAFVRAKPKGKASAVSATAPASPPATVTIEASSRGQTDIYVTEIASTSPAQELSDEIPSATIRRTWRASVYAEMDNARVQPLINEGRAHLFLEEGAIIGLTVFVTDRHGDSTGVYALEDGRYKHRGNLPFAHTRKRLAEHHAEIAALIRGEPPQDGE